MAVVSKNWRMTDLGGRYYSNNIEPAGGGSGEPDVFLDDFDYTLSRSEANPTAAIQSRGWQSIRTVPAVDADTAGYIYTAAPADIPSYDGSFPGTTQRCLVLEGRPGLYPGDLGGGWKQTDHYLRYGAEEDPRGTIPANAWIRFWLRIVQNETWNSRFGRGCKFIYPTGTSYPATGYGFNWLLELDCRASEDLNPDQDLPSDPSNYGEAFLGLLCHDQQGDPGGFGVDNANANEYPAGYARNRLYQNLELTPMSVNTWYEITLNVNTSGAQGQFHAWRRPRNGARVKIAEWVGSSTPGMIWPTHADWRTGEKALSIPTTQNNYNHGGSYGPEGDVWMLMQDFSIATSEGDLITYDDEP